MRMGCLCSKYRRNRLRKRREKQFESQLWKHILSGPIKLQDGSIIIDAEQDPDALTGHLADVCEDEDDFNRMDDTCLGHMFSDSFAARRIASTEPFKRGLHSFEVSARIAENIQELYDLRQHDVSSLDREPMQIFKGSNEDTSVSLPVFPRRVFHRGESSVERAYFERMQIAHVTICNESNGDETSTPDTRNTNLHTRYSMQHLGSRSETPTAMSDCEDADIVEGIEEDTIQEEPEEDEVALYEIHNRIGAYEEYIDENNSVMDDLYFAHHGHHIEFDLISVSDFGNNSVINELSESHIMISPKLFEQLAQLPTKQYELSELHQENACQICMEIYQSGDILKTLPCFHDYHDACIDEWLKENITCPICRTVIECLEGDDEQTEEYDS
ncbi:uncharacterized protein LOC127869470 [Dreissena polymorpha]|uniref:RING-type domain-containing protein n=1 Tax=Dreissena polymorpha TaxID=45954 RepID=A0A9D4RNU4_DREPO|nr:uncharacterized protein LOC127869470 [Dreissena polymorpha]KAH3875791.1 hypothetical protein DPMN_039068 [Dreissena polymorpha]